MLKMLRPRLLSLALVTAFCSLSVHSSRAEDFRIGFTGPITGPAAFLGMQMKWGAELAAEDVNAHGGVLGRKLSVEMQDSQCRPADALSAAEKLLSQDQVDALLGDLCSGATLALMPVVEKAGKPMIVSISTLPAITAKAGVGGNKWVFRTVPNDSMMADAGGDKLKASGIKSIAFLAEDTDYGRESVRLLKTKLGPDVEIVSEDYVKNTEADFLSILTKLRSSKPGALALFMLDQQGFNLMKQYVQFGLTMPLVGRPPLVASQVKDLLTTGKFDGSWTIYPYFDQYHSTANDNFVSRFTEKYKQGPHYVAYGIYESIMVLADAARQANSADPEALRAALSKLQYKGILGPIAFDPNDQAHNNMMYLVVEHGKLDMKELVSTH